MGGKSSTTKALEKQQLETNASVTAIAKQQADLSAKNLQQRDSLRAPLIQQQTAFASGDRNAVIGAGAPIFGAIDQKARADSAQIDSTVGGAERDFLKSQVSRDRTNQIYQFMSSVFQSAPQNLAALASEDASLGQNQAGTGLNAFNSSSNIANNLMQLEAQRRAQTLGFLGSLAGLGGQVAGGFIANAGKTAASSASKTSFI